MVSLSMGPFKFDLCSRQMPFLLRLKILAQRCALINLEDNARVANYLQTLPAKSQHMLLLSEGLKQITIDETRRRAGESIDLATECTKRHLVLLECEAVLVSLCLYLVLIGLGEHVDLQEMKESLAHAQDLCQMFPDSAGLLAPACQNIDHSISHTHSDIKTIYTKEIKEVLWHLPSHRVGALERCTNGHIYSKLTSLGCPECGRQVVRPIDTLHHEDFLLAMNNLSTSFDDKAYKREVF